MNNKIYPCLWFDNNAKEAAEYYCSVFNGSEFREENHFIVNFISNGQKFMFMNGGPHFKVNPSISFFVTCETEKEIDEICLKLLKGGMALMPLDKYPWSEKYAWLQDKYGVSWQLSLNMIEQAGQKFTPAMMFAGNNSGKAESAMEFYTSLFPDSAIELISRYEAGEHDVEGNIKYAQFSLGKHIFAAMDSSMDHKFDFNEGISFVVECQTQAEIDFYWQKLSAVPEAEQCGWLKDQYGVSWQIIPSVLISLMRDREKAPRVTEAFMKMKKFDIETLIQAAG